MFKWLWTIISLGASAENGICFFACCSPNAGQSTFAGGMHSSYVAFKRYTMIPNTSKVSQTVFVILYKLVWLIWGCLKTIYLFGCLRRSLVVSNSSHPNMLATQWFRSKFWGYECAVYSWTNSTGRFDYIATPLDTLFNNNLNIFIYLGNKVWKTQPPKIVGKFLEHTTGVN